MFPLSVQVFPDGLLDKLTNLKHLWVRRPLLSVLLACLNLFKLSTQIEELPEDLFRTLTKLEALRVPPS